MLYYIYRVNNKMGNVNTKETVWTLVPSSRTRYRRRFIATYTITRNYYRQDILIIEKEL